MSDTLPYIMKPVQKPHSSLGSLVRTKREAMGLSQQALADQAGVSRESVNRLENATGAWAPRPRKVAQILLVLEITVPEVTDTVDDPELYVELVSEMDKLATADFRAYVSHHVNHANEANIVIAQSRVAADLILVSPSGTTCFVEVKGTKRDKGKVSGELVAALQDSGWIVSATV